MDFLSPNERCSLGFVYVTLPVLMVVIISGARGAVLGNSFYVVGGYVHKKDGELIRWQLAEN